MKTRDGSCGPAERGERGVDATAALPAAISPVIPTADITDCNMPLLSTIRAPNPGASLVPVGQGRVNYLGGRFSSVCSRGWRIDSGSCEVFKGATLRRASTVAASAG